VLQESKVLGFGDAADAPLRLIFNSGLVTEDSKEIFLMLVLSAPNSYSFDSKQSFVTSSVLLSNATMEHFYQASALTSLPGRTNFLKFTPTSTVENAILNWELLGDLGLVNVSSEALFPSKTVSSLPPSLRSLQASQLKDRLIAVIPAALNRLRANPMLCIAIIRKETRSDGSWSTRLNLALPVSLELSQTQPDFYITISTTGAPANYSYQGLKSVDSVRKAARLLGRTDRKSLDASVGTSSVSHHPTHPTRANPLPCKFWASSGYCRNGANCNFRHD
jgi:hypothetical protein